MSRDVVKPLGCSGEEKEIPLAFHVISEDKSYLWIFDVVDEPTATLVVGLDWLCGAGQSLLAKRQTSVPIIEPVPISGKAAFDNQDANSSLDSHARRPASASPHMANSKSAVSERDELDHRRISDLAVPDPSHRPQSAPAQEKAENASGILFKLLYLNKD